jgi:hypothetical protein
MEIFNLPHTTKVNRVIPKNAFDNYTTTKQKKLFANFVLRITWSHKLSPDTLNLEAKDIKEIQVFRIELKTKEDIRHLLEIIDRAIPYNIIFAVEYENIIYLSTSIKHPNPLDEHNAVIDWTFKTDWFFMADNKFKFALKKSLDFVYHDLCVQLSGNPQFYNKPLPAVVEQSKLIDNLRKEVAKLKVAILKCRQFNQKVELNMQLKAAESQLQTLS